MASLDHQSDRLPGVDVGRAFAAYSVIWLHAPEEPLHATVLGRWAVPFFTATACFFAARASSAPLADWIRLRFLRTYRPFLVWNGIYLAVRELAAVALGGTLFKPTGAQLLWDGVAHQLWFLPFVFALTVVVQVLVRATAKPRHLAATLLATGGICLLFERLDFEVLRGQYALSLSWDHLPAGLWGASVALFLGKDRSLGELAARTRGLAWTLFLACIAALWFLGKNRPVEVAAGIVALFAYASLQGRLTTRVAPLGQLAFTIYIAHVLFLEGFQDVLAAASIEPSRNTLAVASFVVAAVASTAFAAVLHQLRGFRFLLAR